MLRDLSSETYNCKSLTKFEKLSEVQELNWHGEERHYVARYLKALWVNDLKTIEEFESFGENPHMFILNIRQYDRALLLGYDNKEFDQHGWLIDPEIFFIETTTLANGNSIEVASGLNDKWIYGMRISTGNAGCYCGVSIWSDIVSSKEKATEKVLNDVIQWHTRENGKNSQEVIKKVNELLEKIKGKGQLELF